MTSKRLVAVVDQTSGLQKPLQKSKSLTTASKDPSRLLHFKLDRRGFGAYPMPDFRSTSNLVSK